jgi:hypothetical protein
MVKYNGKRNIMKSLRKTTEKTLPIIDKGLQKVGSTTKNFAREAVPIVENGVSVVYGTMNTGFNLGVKGANMVAKGVKKATKKKSIRKQKKTRKQRKTRKH